MKHIAMPTVYKHLGKLFWLCISCLLCLLDSLFEVRSLHICFAIIPNVYGQQTAATSVHDNQFYILSRVAQRHFQRSSVRRTMEKWNSVTTENYLMFNFCIKSWPVQLFTLWEGCPAWSGMSNFFSFIIKKAYTIVIFINAVNGPVLVKYPWSVWNAGCWLVFST